MENSFIIEIIKQTGTLYIIPLVALYLMSTTWKKTADRLEAMVAQNQRIIERNTAVFLALLRSIDKGKEAEKILYDELGFTESRRV